MKAILFAAGLGTRIQSVSKGLPKALLDVNGMTLVDHAISYLIDNRVDEIIINVHHQSDLVVKHLESNRYNCNIIISDETNKLLDTGGGLLKAKEHLKNEDCFIAYNVDILTNLDLKQMAEIHKSKNDTLATLAVRDRSTSRYLLFDKQLKMIGWENRNSGERILHTKEDYLNAFAFSGIHIISNKIFDLLERTNQEVFSITKSYIELSENNNINAYNHTNDYWFDVGKPETYQQACDFLKNRS
jgi:NDP-sugar pyrophosphorylase family protein